MIQCQFNVKAIQQQYEEDQAALELQRDALLNEKSSAKDFKKMVQALNA